MSVNRLPTQSTAFIGRENELSQIADLLANPACRLLTLTGTGGIGKTRLGIEAARRISLPNGACFVPLQPLTSPDFMVSTIADALKLSFYGDQNPKIQLLNYLREKHLLLVLDNFEHLTDAADLLPDMLEAAPNVKVLVTSRERLNLVEEWVLEIGGLDCPTSETEADIEHFSAVELFVQHARQVNVRFTLTDEHKLAVTRICQSVGGMPLGIELAAAWVRILSCQAIADEIAQSLDILETPARNVEPRHRTMRAAFEPTWNRLSEAERSVFMKLSIFHGGFTRNAAEDVAGASLNILSALVDKSLLRLNANGRYELHELLRQYGTERLNESAEEAQETHNRHCSYYAHFLENQWSRLTGSAVKSALSEIETELDNIHAAWDWAVSHHKAGEIEAALDSLWFFYDQGDRYYEGEQVFARAVRELKASVPEQELLWAKVLARHGALCCSVLLPDKSATLLEESIVVLGRVNAYHDLAFALNRLGMVIPDDGLSKGIKCQEESLAIYTELADLWGMGQALYLLGGFYCTYYSEEGIRQGSTEALRRAQQYAHECMAVYQSLGSPYGIAFACVSLGETAYWMAEYEQAYEYYQRSLVIFQDIGIHWGIPYSLRALGTCACRLGQYSDARSLALQALQILFDHGLISTSMFISPQLLLIVEIWLGEGKIEQAYELAASVDEWRRKVGFAKNIIELRTLSLLDENLPPDLAAAVERGRTRDFNTVVQEVFSELTQQVKGTSLQPALSSSQSLADLLTERELEILHLLADGLNSREVAQHLVLSVGTVRWYLKHIYGKLDVHSRSEAIARARALNLLG